MKIQNAILHRFIHNVAKHPKYTLMRMLARFAVLRKTVAGLMRILHLYRMPHYERAFANRLDESLFKDIDIELMVKELNEDGVSFGLKLPEHVVNDILDYADRNYCYADRNPKHGFIWRDVKRAEESLGKSVLVAQYFNTLDTCPSIKKLKEDPVLNIIACRYLQATPQFVGANLWWTFPTNASKDDKNRHAHLYHRDVDDFKFFKFFFYITEVRPGDGAHVCVRASHRKPPCRSFFDRWSIRRYADEEIIETYDGKDILEICDEAGSGFAENTFNIHKGLTPTQNPRLLLQLQFSLFDYGVMHDNVNPSSLKLIV